MKKLILPLLLCLIAPLGVSAQEAGSAFRSTDYPLPRFVSVAAGEAFVRAGPGRKFPVKWVLKQKRLPVEIILEYDAWRKIRDIDGDEGWVHQSLLSGKRTGIIQAQDVVALHKKPKEGARVLVKLEPFVLVTLSACETDWCKVDAAGYKGWLRKTHVWGVYEAEIF